MKTLLLKYTETTDREKEVLVPDGYVLPEQWKLSDLLDELDDQGHASVRGRSEITVTEIGYNPDAEVLVDDPAQYHYSAAIFDSEDLHGSPIWESHQPSSLANVAAAAINEIQNTHPRAVIKAVEADTGYHVYASAGGLVDNWPIALIVITDTNQ
ncbi:hypothetical protein [Mycobacteroides abscessus]|uniref:hypothetical protein n=1 Tax=Mycobacteroides abscessus TaxID=36809 RepID=UPI0009A7D031|nr:hypothetical protein [Mycobacteroides abscessus]SKO15458.1 Uncharacterised protein [Mycobacteroides abscessus subsp. bolletii]SKX37321.1 Uncharacterised protein [Mycobacteroides abscessus subsp. bolletii]